VVLDEAQKRELPTAEIVFDYSGHHGKISILEPFAKQAGWLTLSKYAIEAMDQAEDYLIFSAITDDGTQVDEQVVRRLFSLSGETTGDPTLVAGIQDKLNQYTDQQQQTIQKKVSERNARYFEEEADKLDSWADDLKLGLEREIKDLDRQIKEARRATTVALTLEEKLAGQKQIKALEVQRNQKRKTLFEAQDQVDRQREELISQIEGKLVQKTGVNELFMIRWRLA